MRKILSSCISAAILLLLSSLSFQALATETQQGGADDFLIQHFESSSPLFDVTVNRIMQDSRGFLWFGTNNGLFRYDGYELIPVEYPGARPGFKRVRSLCEDQAGDVWIGTNGGLFRYCRSAGKAIAVRPEDPGFTIVSKVVALPGGKVALCARNYGAWMLNPESGDFSRISLPDTPEDETLAICLGDAGMLYFLSPEGLFRLDPSRSLKADRIKIQGDNSLEGQVFYDMAYWDYRVIAGIPDRTFIIDLRSGEVDERDWSVVNAVWPRDGGGFYAATNRGLLEVNERMEETRRWTEDLTDNYAIHDKSVHSMCVDREGNLWLGTSYDGVYIMARNRSGMQRFYPSGLTPAFPRKVRSIEEDPEGILWIGSENGGLVRYDRRTGSIMRVPLPLETSNILALCVDGPWLWIGSYSRKEPTIRLNRRTLKATPMPNLPKCLYYIFKGEDNYLFLSDDNSLFRYDTATGVLEEDEVVSPAGFQYVKGVKGTDGEIWMGGIGAIIYRHKDGETVPLSDLVEDEDFRKLLTLRNASPKLVDSRSGLWVTLLHLGLYRIDIGSGSVRKYEIISGNNSAELYNVMEDREGMIWVTTANGLISLDPVSGKFFTYDKSDGIMSAHFKSSSGIIASNGNLYAGMMEGMLSFDPVKFRSYSCKINAPVFTGFSLIRSSDSPEASDKENFSEGLEKGKITLKASQNAFVVGVSDMNYSIPKRSRLVYSLDGGQEWKFVENGKINFSHLRHGDYILRVRSMMNDSSLDGGESVLKIKVRLPLMISAPFIVLYVILLFTLLVAVSKFVERRSVRKASEKARLDAEVREAERQKELWSSKVEFLTDVAHEIRNPLSLVKAPVESLRLRLGKSADSTVVREIDTVSRNADKLSEMLDSLLEVHGGGAYLPRTSQSSDDIPDVTPPRMNVPGTVKEVLIVEQDAEIMSFLCGRLEDTYNVYSARSIAEAGKILKEKLPDIILCDTDTGTTESYAFCTKLKSAPETAPIPLIIISDNSGQEARVNALNRGAEGFFSKPFSILEMMGAIRSLLENRDNVKGALTDRPAVSADKDFLKTLQKIMEAHLSDENLSVDTLAEKACMSSSSLFKKLKALTGMSPGEYITATRMKEAASLMKNTALTIDDISIKVGFRSHSYFSTCFKNRYGMSPKKFRQLSEPSSES